MKKRICSALLFIFMPLFILLFSFQINVFNIKYFLKEYEKYNISQETHMNMEELEKTTVALMKYLAGVTKELKYSEKYSNNDIIHLKDVRVLFQRGIFLEGLSLFILLWTRYFLRKKDKKLLRDTVKVSSAFSIILLLLLIILSIYDFNRYFTYFHLILFDNDYWLLDPKTDLLIRMFPESFFIDIFRRIGILFIAILSIILIYEIKNERAGD
ncbi:TIGR01906 family membrane protein [Sporanaerobacter sp. PP17-6a]|uniref:TIGR01906 family membrane protein n=1 Tax=Sporanaerobacter sp. PP17-6a TaxID=1891289 RepID=UPI00089FE30B|nr:TIGR01906 family membrane protein [Sporanaerobacter sp. PP17-6a]MBE6081370.1 TIGR01906 family membrane protein [Tissierellaceae bacterium]SCL84707.1 integral membrane protein [Sporanaerobacter sp. PP17-6a]